MSSRCVRVQGGSQLHSRVLFLFLTDGQPTHWPHTACKKGRWMQLMWVGGNHHIMRAGVAEVEDE